jgi:hypothetical protein
MFDTGIDYTHYNLGGSGKVADYNAAVAVASGAPPANLFPTSKVIGGFDFVGDVWPAGPLQPDPNPIDLNGHGTETADALGGHSLDNVHFGMAPGTQLYAVKVCSNSINDCSNVALLEALDFALDPNGTGTLNDAVDVISASLGEFFGQAQDDLSEAFADVVKFGVVSTTAAGNDSDIPYVMASPASTPEVIAVGATNNVVAFTIPLVINSPASIAGTYSDTATVGFAPVTTTVTSNVAYVGRGCPAGSINGTNPADTYLTSPSGMIALIDRGACNVSLKIDAAARAGAVAVVLGLVAPGDPVSFSEAGGSDFVPSLVITQATSNLIKNALISSRVNATINPGNAVPLSENIGFYTSRGPNYSFNMLKPDLSAPGNVIAAQAGTGNGQTNVIGTSFATPLAGGAAALLLSKNPSLKPLDVKSLLMETTDPLISENVLTEPGVLAPMSRMGAGELRAGQAASATTAAWDSSYPLAVSLSFGTYRLNQNQEFTKTVTVRNYSNTSRTYQITNTYRDAPNMTGVAIATPPSVFVGANSTAQFELTASVNVASLPVWTLNGGFEGGNGELLNTVEYAGYLTFTSGSENIHLPWHILPHKSANVSAGKNSLNPGASPEPLPLSNGSGAVGGLVDIFSLTGTGHKFPPPTFPGPGAGFSITNLQSTGVRLVCFSNCASTTPFLGVQFAITTFEPRSHPDYPAEFDITIDLNGDGVPDLAIFNADLGPGQTGPVSGQNAVWVFDSTNHLARPYSYAIADLDSANMIFTVPLVALRTSTGLSLNYNTPFTFSVFAYDNYFTGKLTDQIGPMRYELDMPQVYPDLQFLTVPAGGSAVVNVIPNTAASPFFTGPYNGNSPSQSGLLLMYRDALAGSESDTVKVNNP